MSIGLRRLVSLLFLMLLVGSLFVFTYPIYDKGEKIMAGWDYPNNLDWIGALEWIQNNTSLEDVIAARFGNYFAWYTNRSTVSVVSSVYPNLNLTGLVQLIRSFNVTYLVVDQSFAWQHPDLSAYYYSPSSFLGAEIVYNDVGSHGYRVLVYNTTKIAFGKYTMTNLIIDEGLSSEYWQCFTYYGNGSLSLDSEDYVTGESSVKLQFTTMERSIPSVAVTFTPQEPLNLSDYVFISVTMKILDGEDIVVKFATDGDNYFTATSDELVFGEWFNVTLYMSAFQQSFGNPTLDNITFLQFYVRGLESNKTYPVWIDSITVYAEDYILGE